MFKRLQKSPRAAGVLAFVCVATSALGAAPANASGPSARSASSLQLNETAQLHRTSSHGLTLNEAGTVTGSIRGTIYIHLKISSNSHVAAEISIYPSNGSLTGYASASYRSGGADATFSGTMSVSRGSGHYARAHASSLRFSGTIARVSDATTVKVSGGLSY